MEVPNWPIAYSTVVMLPHSHAVPLRLHDRKDTLFPADMSELSADRPQVGLKPTWNNSPGSTTNGVGLKTRLRRVFVD